MKTREVEFEVVGKNEGRPPAVDVDPFIALVSRLMDNAFAIPGTKIRFGLDPLISLIPGFGASSSAAVSLVLIALSARRGVPRVVLARMAGNVLINAVFDTVPVLGDALSIFYRSNAKNYELLRRHAGTARPATKTDWLFLVGLIVAVVVVIGLIVTGAVVLAAKLFRHAS